MARSRAVAVCAAIALSATITAFPAAAAPSASSLAQDTWLMDTTQLMSGRGCQPAADTGGDVDPPVILRPSTPVVVVSDAATLIAELAVPGPRVVEVARGAAIDLGDRHDIPIASGVTLRGQRGPLCKDDAD